MSNVWRNKRLGGLLFESNAPAGPVAEIVRAGTLPARVDLRPWCSPIEDQGDVGSCAANAAVGALELHQRRAKVPHIDLSRLFVYYNARKMAGKENDDCGTMMSHVMAAVMAFGACEEKLWPYIESRWPEKPTDDCYTNAERYEAVVYARVPLGEGCLQMLAKGLPVVFGTRLPGEYYHIGGETAHMPVVGSEGPPPGDGHAMLIVGYDLEDQTWLIRNSWGSKFGDGGYCKVPFKTMQAYSHPDFFWIFGAIEQASAGDVRLSGPSMREAVQQTRAAAPQQVEDSLTRLKKGLRQHLNNELDAAKNDLRKRLRGPGVGGGY